MFCCCCPVTYLLCFALVETKIAQIGGGGGSRVGRNIKFLYTFVLQACNELHGTGNSTALRNEKIQPSLFLWRNSASHVCFLLNVLHPHGSLLQQPLTSMLGKQFGHEFPKLFSWNEISDTHRSFIQLPEELKKSWQNLECHCLSQ